MSLTVPSPSAPSGSAWGWLTRWVTMLVLFLVWEWLARFWLPTSQPDLVTLMPPPSGVLAAGWELLQSGDLLHHLWASLKRELTAFGFALVAVPLGIAMGLVVISMCVVTWMPMVYALLIAIGALAGFFVVPMNAMLQHRGHVLMSAGHSIAVQNFNENLCILVMLGLYAFLISHDVHINWIVLAFGLFVAGAMLLVKKRHEANQAERDSLHLIGIEKH